MLHPLTTVALIEVPFADPQENGAFPIGRQDRNLSRSALWDSERLSPNVTTVMSLPSPDGSTSSILSSEDSTSSSSAPKARQHNHHHFHHSRRTSHPSQPLPSSASLMVGPSVSQLSSRPVKICGVCGDRAKSYHFGGISCDSCKAFFRRSVQNDAYKNFHCPYEGQCDITIMSRKCCQHCRFQKCISIGMEKSWVMTEEERLQMLKTRLEKRQRQDAKESCKSMSKQLEDLPRYKCDFEPDIGLINKYLSEDEISLIESIINHYLKSCKEIAFNEELIMSKLPRNRTEILDMFFTAIQQFALFAQRFEAFKKISPTDQEILLRGGVLELCFVRGAFLFDLESQSWLQSKSTSCSPLPYLAAADLKPLIRDDLVEKHMRFIKMIKDIDVDESTIMLLCVIILLSPDRPGLTDPHFISKQQEFFLILLRKYMNWRYSERKSSTLYPKLLLTLPELRELSEGHTDYHLWLCREELEEIQIRLSSLRLDPLGSQCSNDPASKAQLVSWSLRANLQKRTSSFDESSTSSESSEKLPSD